MDNTSLEANNKEGAAIAGAQPNSSLADKTVPKASRFKLLGIVFIVILIACFFVLPLAVDWVQVSSNSMSPTFKAGDYLVIETLCTHMMANRIPLCDIRRGEVIVFVRPTNSPDASPDNGLTVKRVVGLSGDRLYLDRGQLIENGHAVSEWYFRSSDASADTRTSWPINNSESSGRGVLVPSDSVFVLGDNRENSLDSRLLGAIPRRDIVGRVLFSLRL